MMKRGKMVNSIGYQPEYIISQDPTRFGGNQNDYLAKAEEAIHAASEKIIAARTNGADLKALFFELIADLSNKRAQIAKENGTKDAEVFGKRRDQYYPNHASSLVLRGVYTEYNKRTLEYFSLYLKDMELKDSPGQFKKEHIIEKTSGGRVSELQFEIFTADDLSKKGYTGFPGRLLPESIQTENLPKLAFSEWSEKDIADYRENLLQFKKDHPHEYQKRRMSNAFIKLLNECPPPVRYGLTAQTIYQKFAGEAAYEILGNMRSLHVLVTLMVEVDNQLYPITQYLTWMYEDHQWMHEQDPAHHPIQRMLERSKVMLLHQDEYSINETLQEISKIFETAVTWNKETLSLKKLRNIMATICHLATHNIRDVRGTAAENEWLAEAIYRSLSVKCSIDTKRMVDLEAFANPLLADFKKAYKDMVKLEFAN